MPPETTIELTDEQIDKIIDEHGNNGIGAIPLRPLYIFVRAIIAADRAQRQAGQYGTEQSLGLYAVQADAIRDLLDRLAPETTGNLQTRIGQVFERQAGQEPVAAANEDDAMKAAWQALRPALGTAGWTVGDSCTYYGFFGWGWEARRQYTAPPAAPVPEGFVLVPLEPTQAMLTAAKAWLVHYQHMRDGDKASARAQAYRAMLAAAPDYPA